MIWHIMSVEFSAKVDGGVSFVGVNGNVYDEVRGIPYAVNCLVNTIDSNAIVTFAVNHIDF